MQRIKKIFMSAMAALILIGTWTPGVVAPPKVDAAPAPITIDGSTATPFTVPADSGAPVEPGADPSFRQTASKKPNFSKVYLRGTTSHTLVSPLVMSTSDGGKLVVAVYYNGNERVAGIKTNELHAAVVYKVDSAGNIVNSRVLGSGLFGVPHTGVNDSSWAYNEKTDIHYITRVTSDSMKLLFYGQIQGDSNGAYRQVIVDTNLNFTYTTRSTAAAPDRQGMNHIIDIDSGQLVQYGFMSGGNLNVNTFDIAYLDAQGNRTVRGELSAGTFYPGPQTAQWISDLSYIHRFADGSFGGMVGQYYLGTVPSGASTGKQVIKVWNPTGSLKWDYVVPAGNVVRAQEHLDGGTKFYWIEYMPNKTVLRVFDMTTGVVSDLQTYPVNTRINIQKNPDAVYGTVYDFYGSIASATGPFAGMEVGLVVGTMKSDFSIYNAKTLKTTGYLEYTPLKGFERNPLDATKYDVAGFAYSQPSIVTPPATGWEAKTIPDVGDGFYGTLKKIDDYAPLIKVTPRLPDINKDVTGVTDAQLLQGVEVKDTFDLDPSGANMTMDQLRAKINKNPKNPTAPIDWAALGMDKNKVGPNGVTYFITDTSQQTSVATYPRIVNVIANTTAIDPTDTIALDASNFNVNLRDVSILNATNVQDATHSNVLGWNLSNGTKFTGNVTVNAAELNAIRTATAAKPYPLTYSVTSGGITVNRTVTVFVVEDNTVCGATTCMYSKDFEKYVREVDNSNAAVKRDAAVRIYNKTTGQDITNTTAITVGGTYGPGKGVYPLQLTVTVDPTATQSIKATVKDGDKPVLNIPNTRTVAVGGVYNPRDGVSATDTEDGDLTAKVIVTSNPVNTGTAGEYTVKYSVTDSDGNVTTGSQLVVVGGKVVDDGKTIIVAYDFNRKVSEVTAEGTSDTRLIMNGKVKVYDSVTKADVTATSIPTVTNNGGYKATAGIYPITYAAPSGAAKVSVSITGTVSSGSAPVLTVPAVTTLKIGDAFNSMTGVTATDAEDGNITSKVVTIGSPNTSIAGTYVITYTVTDSDGNVAMAKQLVAVDGVAVCGTSTCIYAQDFTKRVGQVTAEGTSDNTVKSNAKVKVLDKTTLNDITATTAVNVSNGGYKATAGSYSLTFTVATDAMSAVGRTATVVTGDKPVLSVPTNQSITKGGTVNTTNGVSATDKEDGDITLKVTNNAAAVVNVNVDGIYPVTYSVTDSDENTVTKVQFVTVGNANPPVVGATKTIAAQNFTKRVSEVGTTQAAKDASAKAGSKVQVWDSATGADITATTPVAMAYGVPAYTNIASATPYELTFTVISEPTTKTTNKATVTKGDAPVLVVPNTTAVAVNGSFDKMGGVTATDTEDGNITGSVSVTGPTVNTAVAGEYKLDYSVTDSDGNTVSKSRLVVVGGKATDDGTKIIVAYDYNKKISEVIAEGTSDAKAIANAKVKVFESVSKNDVTSTSTITVTQGGYTAVAGVYPMTFTTPGGVGNVSVNIKATVAAGNAPVLTVKPSQAIANGGTVDTTTGVSATDAEDGNITSKVTNDAGTVVKTTVEGIYTVTYKVTDSDGNTVEQKQIVAVGPYKVVDGTTTIIVAKDYTKRVGEVVVNDGAVKTAANVHVFDKTTKTDITGTTVVNVVYGVPMYAKAAGSYPLTFVVATDTTAAVGRTATVVTGDIPVLNVPTNQTITKGGSVNTTTGVSATDTEDGNITSKVTNNAAAAVDVNVDGNYPVVYSVTDSDGNTATKVQFVTVGSANPPVVGPTKTIAAQNFTKRVSEVGTTQAEKDASAKAGSKVRVWDSKTGADITATTAVSMTYGVPAYTNVASATPYEITFAVTAEPTTKTTNKATVTAGDAPVLVVPNTTSIPVGGSFIAMTNVSATDKEDGNITSKVVVSGQTVNPAVAGTYKVDYTVADSDGNTVSKSQLVVVGGKVVDDGTRIIVAYDFSKKVSDVVNEGITDAKAIQNAKVKVFESVSKNDVTAASTITVTQGGYKAAAGVYPMTFTTPSGVGTVTVGINATVNAGNVPVLTVKPSQAIANGGTVDTTTGVSATDTEDGDITSKVTNDATAAVNPTVEGIYTVTYKVTDSDGNTAEQKQIVAVGPYKVVDGATTIIVAKDYTKRVGEVVVNDGAVKTAADVHVFDKTTKEDITTKTTVNVVYGVPAYAKAVGTYPITFVVATDLKAAVARTATVVAGDKPVLTVPVQQTIAKGGSVNTTNGVSATDTEDGDITSKVTNNAATAVDVNVDGNYPVTYSVTDSDGNTVTKVQFVTVGDANPPVVGPTKTIAAQNFTKRVSEVGTTQAAKDASAKAGSKVQVWDSKTGADITATNAVSMTYGVPAYTNVASATPYEITFAVTAEPTTKTTNKATVIAGDAPVLTVPNTTSVAVNGSFDKMGGVSATDKEDGNITSKVVVSGQTVNPAVAGTYKVDYTVTDSDGNTVSKSQLVVVGGKVVDDGTRIIVAYDFNKKVSEVLAEGTTDAKAIQNAKVKVFESVSKNDVTSSSTITAAQGGYTATVGVYTMTFTTPSGAGSVSVDIKATVSAGNAPVLTVKPSQAIANGGTVDTTTGVSATDAEDGNITSKVTNDAGTVVKTTVEGIYTVTYKVTDSDGNTVEQKQIVAVGPYKVVDGTTTIIVAKDFTKRVADVVLNDGAVKSAADVHVFDKTTKADITATTNVNVVYGSPAYAKAVGTYPITFVVATDTTATVARTATVTAGDKPVLNVPTNQSIAKGGVVDTTTGVSATDKEDGDITSKVTNNATAVNVNVDGNYPVVYSVTDSDGNTVTKVQFVTVGSANPPVVGPTKAIAAQDFTKRVSEVGTTQAAKDASAKAGSKVQVWDSKTGADITTTTAVTMTYGAPAYTNIASATPYGITFTVTAEPTTKATNKATVTAGDAPVLTVPNTSSVAVNGSFDKMGGVLATDTEDGNITSKVVVSGQVVNTAVAGTYKVDYTVTDTDGNTASKSQLVVVGGKVVDDGTRIIVAYDFNKKVSEVLAEGTTDAKAIQNAKVKVFESVSKNDVTAASTITVTQGGYAATVGVYPMTFTTPSGASDVTVGIKATVSAGNAPVLTVKPSQAIANGGTVDTTTGVSATDAEDGNITSKVTNDATAAVNPTVEGIYTVTYKVTDSDGNTAEQKQIVAVGPYKVVDGATTIIVAKDYTKRVGEVVLDDGAVKTAADVHVFDKTTKDDITGTTVVNVVYGTPTYAKAVGAYPLTFVVATDIKASVGRTATVVAGDKPVLTVPVQQTIAKGGAVDTTTGVSATDKEDGDITSKVTNNAATAVDVNVDGNYPVVYSVTDSDGNTVTKVQFVTVGDANPPVVGPTKTIAAQNFTKRVSEVGTTQAAKDASAKAGSKVQVWDSKTGADITGSTPVTMTYGVPAYTNVASATPYEITFAVTAEPTTKTTNKATVTAGDAPVLVVPNTTAVAVGGSFSAMTNVSAIDKEDGNITSKVVVSGQTVNTAVAGTYKVDYTVTDSDGNKVSKSQLVVVGGKVIDDGTRIIVAYDFSKKVSEVIAEGTTDAKAIANAKVKVFESVSKNDVTAASTITVAQGGYTATVGVYTMTFTTPSGTSDVSVDIKATVSAGNVPVLTVRPSQAIANGGTVDTTTGVSATDKEDGDLTSKVTNDATTAVKTTVEGIYTVTYKVTDSDGNTVEQKQIVAVGPYKVVDGVTTIIVAKDFTKRVNDVVLNDGAVKTAADVHVYDKTTKDDITATTGVNVVYGVPAYAKAVGTYPITFVVATDAKAVVARTATVVAGDKPVLTVPVQQTIAKGGVVDTTNGVSATDTEDGDITSKVTNNALAAVNVNVDGNYPVTYSVTDSDGNTVTKVQFVTVGDANPPVVGPTKTIAAQNFTKRVSEVGTTQAAKDASAKAGSKVQVWDSKTGADITATTAVSMTYGVPAYTNVASATPYEITFAVTAEPTTKTTNKATVIAGDAPVLTVPNTTSVAVNGAFDKMTGVNATDTEDGNITSKVVVSGQVVNTAVAGTYKVDYTVTDSDGNKVSKSQLVVVGGKVTDDGTKIIVAYDFSKKVSEVIAEGTTDAKALQNAKVKVFDSVTKNDETATTAITVAQGGYAATEGEYTMTFTAPSGASVVSVDIKATVTAGNAPVLTVPNTTSLPLGSIFNPMTGVSATDKEDGNITSKIVVSGQTVNTAVAGEYKVDYTVADSDGNTVSKSRLVVVGGKVIDDGTKIIVAYDFSKKISEVIAEGTTDALALANAKVKVFDSVTKNDVTATSTIAVAQGGYKAVAGIYSMTFTTPSGASIISVDIKATVTAGNAPMLTVRPSQAIANGGVVDTTTGVSATDKEDGDLTSKVTNDAATVVNTTVEGIYTVTYKVTDSDGNTAEQKQVVAVGPYKVVDGTTTIIVAKDYTKRVGEVVVNDGAVKAAADVHVFDKTTKDDITAVTTVNVVYGTPMYAKAVGTYPITFVVATDIKSAVGRTATVVAGDVPVLNVPVNQSITKGGKVDTKTGVSAMDTEDGDITSKVTNNAATAVNVNVDGNYPVVYSVTDSDGNTATKVQFVTVGDANPPVVGPTKTIAAQNFTKRVSEVGTTQAAKDASAKAGSKVQVWDSKTGADITATTAVSMTYGVPAYTNVASATPYEITFEVTAEPTTKTTNKATVTAGDAPVLTVPNTTAVAVGGAFDKMGGVNATDKEDGNITSKVVVSGQTVNTAVAGEYKVDYTVTDSDGNTVSKSQLVVVGGKVVDDGTKIIVAYDFIKKVSEVIAEGTTDAQAIQNAKVKVFDSVTKADETAAATIAVAQGGYKAVAGVYPMTFTTPSGAGIVSVDIKATVAVGEKPVLVVKPSQSIANGGTVDITTGVSATDKEDGDITSKVTNDAATAVNTTVEGIYTVTYKVTDSDGNTVEQKQIVTVGPYQTTDGATTIIVAKNYTKRVGEVVLNDGAVKKAADVHVFDKVTKDDITATTNVNVVYGVPSYAKAVGSYPITFVVATDTKASVGRIATVVAGDKPVLTAPVATALKVGDSFDPMAGVDATDTEDGNLKSKVTFTSNVDTTKAGTYKVDYSVTDSDGNTVTRSQLVAVDKAIVVGKDYIIVAQDFTKRTLDVDVNPATKVASIKKAADLHVFEQGTVKDVTASQPVTTNDGGYTNVAGVYPIEFTLNSEPTTKLEIKATVTTPIKPAAPTIDPVDSGDKVVNGEGIVGDTITVTFPNGKTATTVVKPSGEWTVDVPRDTKLPKGSEVSAVQADKENIVSDPTKVIVTDKSGPVLTHPAFTEIKLDPKKPFTFDPMYKVSAVDAGDGDLTKAINFNSTVIPNVAGVYTVDYDVTDSDGNKATGRQTVLLNDGTYVVDGKYIIHATDFTKRVSEVTGSDEEIKTASGVKVYDNTTGLEIPNPKLVITKGGYSNKPGTYDIKLKFNPEITIKAHVIIGDVPTIDAPKYTEIKVGAAFDPTKQNDGVTDIVAKDTEDGILGGQNFVITSGVNNKKAGIYQVTYKATDKDGNITTAKRTVVVNDGTYVTGDKFILHASNFTNEVTEVDTSDAAVRRDAKVSVYNKETLEDVTVNEPVVVSIGSYKAAVGTYSDISFTVKNDAKATKDVTATVVDTIAPLAPPVNPVTTTDTVVTGRGEKGATVTVKFADGSSVQTVVNQSGNWQVTVPTGTTLVAGETVKASQADASGNKSPETTVTITDRTAPLAPPIDPVETGDQTVTGKGEVGGTITVTFPDGKTVQTVVDQNGKWIVSVPAGTVLPVGSVVKAYEVDRAGNKSDESSVIVRDTKSPLAPVIDKVETTDKKVTGKGEAGSTVTVTFPDGKTATAVVDANGRWTVTVPAGTKLPLGKDVTAVQQDAGGNISPQATTRIVDTIAPDAPIINPVKVTDTKVTGTGEAGSTVTVTFPDGKTVETTVDADGTWSVNVPKGTKLAAGSEVKAYQTDIAGNVSPNAKIAVEGQEEPKPPVVEPTKPVVQPTVEIAKPTVVRTTITQSLPDTGGKTSVQNNVAEAITALIGSLSFLLAVFVLRRKEK